MAMTKKEQADMKAAIDRAETLAALRWTMPVKRDVAPPANGFSEGWDFNDYMKSVRPGWSNSIFHGEGSAPKEGERRFSATQNPRSLYSTKAMALAALRHGVEKKAAHDLMQIDRQIIEAMAEAAAADAETPTPCTDQRS
jgi:hypothetical protein